MAEPDKLVAKGKVLSSDANTAIIQIEKKLIEDIVIEENFVAKKLIPGVEWDEYTELFMGYNPFFLFFIWMYWKIFEPIQLYTSNNATTYKCQERCV